MPDVSFFASLTVYCADKLTVRVTWPRSVNCTESATTLPVDSTARARVRDARARRLRQLMFDARTVLDDRRQLHPWIQLNDARRLCGEASRRIWVRDARIRDHVLQLLFAVVSDQILNGARAAPIVEDAGAATDQRLAVGRRRKGE